jgi:hypothetical protein
MDATIVPIVLGDRPARRLTVAPAEVKDLTFSQMDVLEADLEEFIRRNIDLVFPDETLLVVGQQVVNEGRGRADLVALDAASSVVLIELKRDADDMRTRTEQLEWQAIRYAANYALLASPSDLVQSLFAPYIAKHREEFGRTELTPVQVAEEVLAEFLERNQVRNDEFNRRQRIVLVASSYNEEVLSACAWLSRGRIDIRCLALSPIEYKGQNFLLVEQVIPPTKLEEYFVKVAGPRRSTLVRGTASPPRKGTLPRMQALIEWGIVKPGDKLYIKNHPEQTALIVDSETVRFNGDQLRFNDWGTKVTGWSAINIYEWAVLASKDRTLDELRRQRMEELAQSAKETG